MIEMEEIKRELIKKHLEDWTGLKQSSIEHFAKSGKASGSFFMALNDMLDDYDKQLRLHNVSGSLPTNSEFWEEWNAHKDIQKMWLWLLRRQ